jgi:hypothetical protein
METPRANALYWVSANDYCRNEEVDGRRGWHLPTIEELMSLVDKQNSFPALPDGHPFQGVGENFDFFFTSSPDEDSIYGQFRQVWLIEFGVGVALTREAMGPPFTDAQARAWCVRGGVVTLPITDVNLEG